MIGHGPTDFRCFPRMLQGWDTYDETGRPGAPDTSKMPHTTLLPGLQFLVARIVGKPAMFYSVAAVRFTYELLGYV